MNKIVVEGRSDLEELWSEVGMLWRRGMWKQVYIGEGN